MNSGIYGAVSGSITLMNQLDVLANNLANVNTSGFKKDTIRFETMLATANPDGTGGTLDSPALVNQFYGIDFSSGPLKKTDSTFDLALDGDGYFVVNTPDGKAYTRQGSFRIDAGGRLVTLDGHEVQGSGGAITINGSSVSFDAEGKIFVDGTQVGTIDVVDFPKPYDLHKIGSALFMPNDPAATGQPAVNTAVRQGFLESSNVNTIEEMVRMIMTTRASETCEKAIQNYDAMTGKAVNDLGKV